MGKLDEVKSGLRLSIVAPYYNIPEPLFRPFLASVFSQDYDNYELILINDGSTDPECIKLLEAIDNPHAKVINKDNGGVGTARNVGIAHMTGDLLCVVDPDDEFRPGTFSHIAECFKEDSEIDLLLVNTDCRIEGGKIKPQRHREAFTFSEEEGFASLCQHHGFMPGSPWEKIYNIKRIGKDNIVPFDTTISRGEDRLWALKMMKNIKKGKTTTFIGYVYNYFNPSGSTKSHKRDIEDMRSFELALEYIESRMKKTDYKNYRGQQVLPYYEMMSWYYLKTMRYVKARKGMKYSEDPHEKYMKDTLWKLHKELKGKDIKDRDYYRRRWITPFLMLT